MISLNKKSYNVILLIFLTITALLLTCEKAEAQTYNAVWVTGTDASPNPMLYGETTTITINTLEYAQWYWLSPSTMVRPIVIVQIAGKPIVATMTSEWLGEIGFWGWWLYWWYNQAGTWTHQAIWDGRDLQGNLVPSGQHLATINVYAGAASSFDSIIINVEYPRKIILSIETPDIMPEGITWVSVTVLDTNNNNMPNYPITLQAFVPQYQGEPCDDCGGHSHDSNRPTGNFLDANGNPIGTIVQGITGSNGEPFRIKYKTIKFGGIETIEAWDINQPEITDKKRLTVRVAGFVCLIDDTECFVKIGGTSKHLGPPVSSTNDSNHCGLETTIRAIYDISKLHVETFGQRLKINDISLPYGGGFDNGGNWEADIIDQYPDDPKRCNNIGHCSHRLGKNIDVDDLTGEGDKIDTEWLRNIVTSSLFRGKFLNEGTHYHLTF